MNKKIKFEKSSGNVFRDLDLPDAEKLFLKATLGFVCFLLVNTIDKRLSKFCDKQKKIAHTYCSVKI